MGWTLLAILGISLLAGGIIDEIQYRLWLRRSQRLRWQEEFRRVQHPNCRCVVIPFPGRREP